VLYNIEDTGRDRPPKCASEFVSTEAARNKTRFAIARADAEFQSMLQRLTRNDRPAA
jgi:hypothetical protein